MRSKSKEDEDEGEKTMPRSPPQAVAGEDAALHQNSLRVAVDVVAAWGGVTSTRLPRRSPLLLQHPQPQPHPAPPMQPRLLPPLPPPLRQRNPPLPHPRKAKELDVEEGVEGEGANSSEVEAVEEAILLAEESTSEALVEENTSSTKERSHLSTKRTLAKRTEKSKAKLKLLSRKKARSKAKSSQDEEEDSREASLSRVDEESAAAKVGAEAEAEAEERRANLEHLEGSREAVLCTCPRGHFRAPETLPLQKELPLLPPQLKQLCLQFLPHHLHLLQSLHHLLPRPKSHPPNKRPPLPLRDHPLPPPRNHTNKLEADALEFKRRAMRTLSSRPAVRKKRNRLSAERTEKTP